MHVVHTVDDSQVRFVWHHMCCCCSDVLTVCNPIDVGSGVLMYCTVLYCTVQWHCMSHSTVAVLHVTYSTIAVLYCSMVLYSGRLGVL